MAKLKTAKDGHFYLTQGYQVLKTAGKEVKFAGYNVETGAERVFVRFGFVDGDRVPEEVFYALLLDGDLYNEAFPKGIEPSSIPNRVLATVESEIERIGVDAFDVSGAKCLLDVIERLCSTPNNSLFTLNLCSWIWIYNKRKTYELRNGGKNA